MSKPRNAKVQDHICRSVRQPDTIRSLKKLVKNYIENDLKIYQEERVWYKELKASGVAEDELRRAAIWKYKGKCHPHQRRVPRVAKEDAAALLPLPLKFCGHFQCLLKTVSNAIGHINGIGELTIYDAANRLRLMYDFPEPEYIYLHCGTRDGSRNLGLDWRQSFLRRDDLLPNVQAAFKELKNDEIEVLLCVCKDSLSQVRIW